MRSGVLEVGLLLRRRYRAFDLGGKTSSYVHPERRGEHRQAYTAKEEAVRSLRAVFLFDDEIWYDFVCAYVWQPYEMTMTKEPRMNAMSCLKMSSEISVLKIKSVDSEIR